MLALLDISTAIDTVDHSILIQRLHISHHVKVVTLKPTLLAESYLHERYQAVTYAGITAPATMVAHGVPHGSVLEPLLFIMYTANIPFIVTGHQLICICYFHMKVGKISVVKGMVEDCIGHVHRWLVSNRL